MKLRVGVIFGGRSGEHEIAIRSAQTVIEQIDKNKYEVVPIAISKDGRWISPTQSAERERSTVQVNRQTRPCL